MARQRPPNVTLVKAIRYLLLIAAFVFVVGVISWISHLIQVSIDLKDTPSASIGISIVAIPMFSILLAVFNYVFWGIQKHERELGIHEDPERLP